MNEFVFQFPTVLWLLFLAPLIAGLLSYARKRRRSVQEAMGGGPSTHRFQRDLMRIATVVLIVLALARPGYAPRMESTSRSGRDVVFALDVSRSMLAEDVSPSRLEVAKQAVRDALKSLGSERAALVVYAGSASVMCPLTYDYNFVRYMVDQAQPRTVDFGGTTLQAAVEKCVDQVFIDGRGGMQDLVVLTDGGDHGSKVQKMIELLEKKQVNVLLIGIGNAETGSPIPIEDADGKRTLLEEAGSSVLTRLDDAALRDFASKSPRVSYVEAGTTPFDLGVFYQNFARSFLHDAADSGTGVHVYQEAAVFLLFPALLLLLLAECRGAKGWRLPWGVKPAICGLMIVLPIKTKAAEASFKISFKSAVTTMEKGDYEAASTQFESIYQHTSSRAASPEELGVLQFNRGLCLLKISESQAQGSLAESLATATEAQHEFLAAKRSAPKFRRAGLRLESTALVLADLQKRLVAQQAAESATQDALKKLVADLVALLKAQQKLRIDVAAKDMPRHSERRGLNTPSDAAELADGFVASQEKLAAQTGNIEEQMKDLDAKIRIPIPGLPPVESILTEPLKLIKDVEQAQDSAATELKVWDAWPAARSHSQTAEKVIKEIIELLSNNSPQKGDSDDASDEMDDEGKYTESNKEEKSTPDSRKVSGDLAAGAEMQALPVPNYSAEDILKEEQGSQQFREQKRSQSNAGKVKEDY